MKRLLPIGLALILIAAGVGAYLMSQRPRSVALIDEDCPAGTRYPFATTLYAERASFQAGGSLYDVGVVDTAGESRRLTSDHASFDPSFSPDGTQLVFTRGYGYYDDTGGRFEREGISVIDVDGDGQRALTTGTLDSEPAWSPAGDLIAFVREETRLMVVPSSGGEPRLVYEDDDLEISSPQWSRDGNRLAFLSGGSVKVISQSGDGLREIASRLGSVDHLRWSPDGETFAYAGIFTVTEEEPNPRELVENASMIDFSSEGDYLLYQELPELPDAEPRIAARSIPEGEPLVVDLPLYVSGDVDWLDCS